MQAKPFKRLLMFSGGGTRFGYYLGAYAALVEHDLAPDIILASCGGSLAASLVHTAPDPKQLKQLATSQALHTILKRIQPKPPSHYQSNTYHSLKRAFQAVTGIAARSNSDHLLQELQDLSVFQVKDEQQQPWLDIDQLLAKLDPIIANNTPKPALALVASRICPNTNPAQLQQLVFIKDASHNQFASSQLTSSQLTKMDLTHQVCALHRFAPNRIVKDIKYIYDWKLADVVRASIADMYYLPPLQIKTSTPEQDIGWCLGGIIDLSPIELATSLSDCVFAETKSDYDRLLAVPAIKRVFGFDPNQRLKQVLRYIPNDQTTLHWLPFADNAIQLKGQHILKKMNLRAGIISLVHGSYADFVQHMNSQWDYGYTRTKSYLVQNV